MHNATPGSALPSVPVPRPPAPAPASRRRKLGFAAAAVTSAALLVPAAAGATVTQRSALMNGDGFTGFDQTNAATGSLTLDKSRAYEGTGSAHATYNGGGANGFARGIFNVDWASGDNVYYGGAFFLPTGFKAALNGQTDLMRHDNYGSASTTDYGGIGVMRGDRRAHLFRIGGYVSGSSGSGSSSDQNVVPAFDLPEGKWFWLEVHQKLGTTSGSAVNEVWVDNALVASSTKANSYARGATRLRYGVVAIGAGQQTKPLDLWFDRALIRTSRIGPLGAATSTPSTGDSGSTSGRPGSTSGSSNGQKRRRIRVRSARVRAGRLTFSVVASKRVATTRYRVVQQKAFRTYKRSIRLNAKQRKRSNVAIRVTLSDHVSHALTLKVRNGRVTAR